MSYLIDTNILLRSIDFEHAMNGITVSATRQLVARNEELIVAPQNLIELWNVMTRPSAKNGLGRTPAQVLVELQELRRNFTLLLDLPEIYPTWKRLASEYQVKGVNVHDTRLVAFMLVHGISHILTFNTKDFQRFNNEIIIVHPNDFEA